MTEEEQARKVFTDRLSVRDGQLFVGDQEMPILRRPQKIDFTVRLPDRSMYTLQKVPCAAIRMATRAEWIAATLDYLRTIGDGDAAPPPEDRTPYYYVLSFD